MPLSQYVQDPNDVQPYAVNWTLDPGDAITASTWVADTGMTVGANSFVNSPAPQTLVKMSFSAGVLGTFYHVVNHITTAQGSQKDHTITILCQQL
jgi:hypothetical protein